jgi:hypothetical protein
MYCEKYILWLYCIEETTFNFEKQVAEMRTQVVKKAPFLPVPSQGDEIIFYRGFTDDNGKRKTLYEKTLKSESTFQSFFNNLNSNFLKGIKVVEENCRKIMEEKSK